MSDEPRSSLLQLQEFGERIGIMRIYGAASLSHMACEVAPNC